MTNRVYLNSRVSRQITCQSVRKHDASKSLTVTQSQKKKSLDLSRGFRITGGSGEIRTRDQRIKRRGIAFEQ